MDELGATWQIYFLHYQLGDAWLIEEGIADVQTALGLRLQYLGEHPDMAQRGQAYVIAPAEPWPRCPGCGQAMVKIQGVPVCVGDSCPRGTGPVHRGIIRRTVKALAGRE